MKRVRAGCTGAARAATAAATVAVLLATTALAGCTARDAVGDTAALTPDDLISSTPAGTTGVDEVTWGLAEGEPAQLAPGADYNYVTPNLCESLLRVTPDFGVENGVASFADWVDPVTFRIRLREGVTFWDGSPVTPADVVYSLERDRDERSAYYGGTVLIVPGPDGIAVTGKNEVTVRFIAPDTTFRDLLSGGGGAVMSKAYGEQEGEALGTSSGGLMCTGPYKLRSWTPGKEIVTVANEDYWDGAPKVGKLTYRFIADGTTMTNALLAGEIDGAYNVVAANRSQFERSDEGRLLVGPSTASLSFGPMRADGLGADPRIREALSMAVDRDSYISTILRGLGTAQSTFVAPFAWEGTEDEDALAVYRDGYDSLPEPTLDIDGARKLVDEVAADGVDTGQNIVAVIPAGNRMLANTAAILQSAAKKIGLTVTIDERQATDYAAIFADPFNESVRASGDLVIATGYTEIPGVLTYPQLMLMPVELGGIFNWTNYDDATVIDALQGARSIPDAKGAATAYVDAQARFTPDQAQVTLAGAYQTSYLADDLTGIVTSISAYSSPWALHLGGK